MRNTLLFVFNTKYLNGSSYSQHFYLAEKHFKGISESEVIKGLSLSETRLLKWLSRLCKVGTHGLEYIDASRLLPAGFANLVSDNLSVLRRIGRVIPFYAYAWRRHSRDGSFLREMRMTPLLMDGQMDFNDSRVIHRELFPSFNTIK